LTANQSRKKHSCGFFTKMYLEEIL
jgi:hypothetical protein